MKIESLILTCVYLHNHCEYTWPLVTSHLSNWANTHLPSHQYPDIANQIIGRAKHFHHKGIWCFSFSKDFVQTTFCQPTIQINI